MTRRRFLVGTGALAGALGLEGLVLEPRRLAVSRHQIGAAPDAAGVPLRVSVLTDLHLRRVGRLERAVAAAVSSFPADLVLLVGDAIDKADALPLLGEFLGTLPPETPKYATLGNWEHWSRVGIDALAATYDRHGGRLLVNESAQVAHRGRVAVLVGVDDMVGGSPDLERAVAGHEEAPNVLLLSHCPAYRDVITSSAEKICAMVSGHTHGGQIAFGPWALFRPPGSGRYVSGWYREAPPDLYVSRGIGTSVLPVRLGSVPEVVHLEWYLS
jgi:predicted MPP superfamily phosphohydrolase